MNNKLRLALMVLALAFGISGCARGPVQPALSTPTSNETLPGGTAPAVTLPVTAQKTPVQQPTAGAQSPTLPTLVPTIAIPTATERPTLAPPTAVPLASTATPAGAWLNAACLVGAWQVTDLQQAMAGSLAQSNSTLALERVDGQARYTFSTDGSMALTYQQLAAVLNGTVDNREVRVVQSLDGTATARYTVDAAAGVIEMSAFGGEGIHSALEINGQTLAEGSLPVWLAFTHRQSQQDPQEAVQVSRASASCDGNTLTLQALEPVPGPALILERVED